MKTTLSRFAVTAMMFVAFMMLGAGLANAKRGGIPPQCTSVITSCGCTIGAPGNYELGNDLYASQGLTLLSGCIDIEGLHVNLTVNYNIYGSNAGNCFDDNGGIPFGQVRSPKKEQPEHPSFVGVGIHVLNTAANVAITNTESTICGWNYGVESDTTNVNIYGVTSTDNNVGLFLNSATDNSCLHCGLGYNVTGAQIYGGSGNSIAGGDAAFSSKYGYWIDGSKHNMISGNEGFGNGLAGIYLGCSSTANVKSQIPCTMGTDTGNSVIDNGFDENGKYGIAVERESFYNNFDGNEAGSNSKQDIIDGNANCVYNNYLDDNYGTKSPSCIQ